MLRGKSGRAHKFAESPVLKLALPAWRSRMVALLLPLPATTASALAAYEVFQPVR